MVHQLDARAVPEFRGRADKECFQVERIDHSDIVAVDVRKHLAHLPPLRPRPADRHVVDLRARAPELVEQGEIVANDADVEVERLRSGRKGARKFENATLGAGRGEPIDHEHDGEPLRSRTRAIDCVRARFRQRGYLHVNDPA